MMQRICSLCPLLCSLLLVHLLGGAPAEAQYAADPAAHTDGITVSGTGETLAKPDVVEVSMRAAANAELTGDAIVKYRDAKRRILEAFDNLKLEHLKIEELGVSLANHSGPEAMQMAMRGMPGTGSGKMQVEISSALQLRLSGIQDMTTEQVMETIGKLLDAAKDSGAGLGPTAAELNMSWRYGREPQGTLVRFLVRDLDKLREEAYESAVADARARAQRLAKLNGIKLGPVLGVHELQVSGDEPPVIQQPWGAVVAAPDRRKESYIASDSFAEIPFRVKLSVRFGIAQDKHDDEAAKTAQNSAGGKGK